MKTRKAFVLLIALMLVVGIAAGGTIAWLATATEPLENTFTTGNINITLSEPNFIPGTDGRFKAIPGDVIQKDPTVTVEAGSEDCYVRIFVINWWNEETDKHFRGTEAAGWYDFNATEWTMPANGSHVDETSNQVLGHVFEFRYRTKITLSEEDQELTAPFTTITVPEWITGEKYASLDNYKVIAIAQAVQAAGFNSADEAFTAAGLPTAKLQLSDDVSKTVGELITALDAQNNP